MITRGGYKGKDKTFPIMEVGICLVWPRLSPLGVGMRGVLTYMLIPNSNGLSKKIVIVQKGVPLVAPIMISICCDLGQLFLW